MIRSSILIALLASATVLVFANPIDLFEQRILLPAEEVVSGYRLPNNTRPTAYEVTLRTDIHLKDELDPQKYKFSGVVTIWIRALEETNYITLHARQLSDLKGRLWESTEELIEGQEEKDIEYAEIELKDDGVPVVQAEYDFITFNPQAEDKKLDPNRGYKLEISYAGVLRTDNQGFYRSFYVNEAGDDVWLATTQFESTDSRHGFPCFDEPSIRATYKISINHDKSYRAISNMPVDKVEADGEDRQTTVFKTSVKTHASILAFVISDFKYIAKEVEDETPQRVFARPEAIASGEGDFGLDAGVALLRQLETYLNTSYSIEKMDQISIPDFSAGAMENWGLVTYREELFLYDPKTSALSLKDKVATIIAHEYAHMFFGNLVSIEWWSYAWLKEGFATYFEYMATAAVYPELRDDDYFVIKAQHNAFATDALETSRPMSFYVENPTAVASVFDFVIYSKAGSVIRMWQHALTEPIFKKGLYYYLEKMQFQAATPDDLAEGLQRAVDEAGSRVQVKNLIDSWSLKAGYPVLHVSRTDKNNLLCTQKKFSLTNSTSTDRFMIPISLTTAQEPNFQNTAPEIWLAGESIEITPSNRIAWSRNDWVIVNVQQSGYYRVNYDADLWELIRKMLWSDDFQVIHHLNRAQLVDDALNLARAGQLNYETALTLVQFLAKEKDFAPWTAADKGFNFLNRLLIDSTNYAWFKQFVNELVTPLYKDLTLNDGGASETLDIKDSRNIAIRWACLTGDEGCVRQTAEKVLEITRNQDLEIEANTRQTVYCYGLRNANSTTFDSIWNRLQATTDLADRTILLQALGCTQDAALQNKYLDSSISETGNDYRPQERNRILDSVYLNGGKSGLEVSIEFLNKNWETVERLYNPSNPVKKAVNRMAELVTSSQLNDKFVVLLNTLAQGGIINDQEVAALQSTVKTNIEWVTENDAVLGEFFKKLYTGSASTPIVSTILMVVVVTLVTLIQ